MTSSRHCGRRATFHAPDNTPLRRSSRRPVSLPVPSRRASMTSQRNGVVGGSRNRRRTLECKPRPRTWTVTNVAAVTKHRLRQPRRVFFARFFRTLQSNSLSACLGLSGRYCSRELFFTRQKGQPTRHRISIGYVGAQFKKSELSVFRANNILIQSFVVAPIRGVPRRQSEVAILAWRPLGAKAIICRRFRI